MWLSWQSGRLQHPRSAVQVLTLANFYIEHLFSVNYFGKMKLKKKRTGNAHFKKVCVSWAYLCIYSNMNKVLLVSGLKAHSHDVRSANLATAKECY